jgi:hypothetical protein
VKKLLIFTATFLILGLETSSFAVQAEIPADSTAAVAKGGTQVTIGGELMFRGSVIRNAGNFDNSSAAGGASGTAVKKSSESGTKPSMDKKN